jgi:sulfite reductase alpha subunit-like flavoprotein
MSSSPRKTEQLYVLYGSQMGNSEQAAKDFCQELETKYSPDYFEQQNLPVIQVETTCIQLDDFLEMHHANFTKCLVIFVSSYGVGQAPLGAYRFRELAEVWNDSKNNSNNYLQGLHYAICGLGDSNYPTYLKNPMTIDQGLTAAGATRIGDLGKANANALGDDAQDKVIARWISDLWLPLAKSLSNDDDDKVNVAEMQRQTIPLLIKLDPDYTPPKELQKKRKNSGFLGFLGMGSVVIGVAVAVVASVFLLTTTTSA